MKTKPILLTFGLAVVTLIGSCATDDCEENPLNCAAFCIQNPSAEQCNSQSVNKDIVEVDSTAVLSKFPVKE